MPAVAVGRPGRPGRRSSAGSTARRRGEARSAARGTARATGRSATGRHGPPAGGPARSRRRPATRPRPAGRTWPRPPGRTAASAPAASSPAAPPRPAQSMPQGQHDAVHRRVSFNAGRVLPVGLDRLPAHRSGDRGRARASPWHAAAGRPARGPTLYPFRPMDGVSFHPSPSEAVATLTPATAVWRRPPSRHRPTVRRQNGWRKRNYRAGPYPDLSRESRNRHAPRDARPHAERDEYNPVGWDKLA